MILLDHPAEAESCWKKGGNACFLAVEGGAVLAGRLEYVQALAGHGVRMLTLTWNGENELAGGSAITGGLKPFGQDALRSWSAAILWQMYPTSMMKAFGM